ncbi:hypothetical protein MA16_Dca024111 [Dendrobium catenatum]|uniref:Uncharacterized protein n=1 Tax=Dendrobium catenatum TaxID=906689 RepID=A0A2I0VA15_9ASPA|nr:hypothetical protein MA16_Dca024111 [Dendrobium catenatum]
MECGREDSSGIEHEASDGEAIATSFDHEAMLDDAAGSEGLELADAARLDHEMGKSTNSSQNSRSTSIIWPMRTAACEMKLPFHGLPSRELSAQFHEHVSESI